MRQQSTGLEQVLPTAEQVEAAVGNRLDPTGPAVIGAISSLPNGIRDATEVSPLNCLGAATPLMRVVYEKGDVRDVAMRDFARFGAGLTVSNVHTGVVRFGSDAEATRLFGVFVEQWRACNRTPVMVEVTPTAALQWTVTDVRTDDGILSATILNAEAAGQSPFATEHAVGVAADCIVDVDVAITGRARPGTRAVDLVRAMLANVTR